MPDNVNGKPGSKENASSENERNVFAGSRSGLSDESASKGKLRRPVEPKSEVGPGPPCGNAPQSLRCWPWQFWPVSPRRSTTEWATISLIAPPNR